MDTIVSDQISTTHHTVQKIKDRAISADRRSNCQAYFDSCAHNLLKNMEVDASIPRSIRTAGVKLLFDGYQHGELQRRNLTEQESPATIVIQVV